jgi:hypothetical protein
MSNLAKRTVSEATRWIAGGIAVLATLVALWLATRYPIHPLLASGLFVLWAGVCYRYPDAWLALVPAVMPVMGFAPWTGWLIAEELDLALAGVVAGGYLLFVVKLGRTSKIPEIQRPQAKSRIPLVSMILLAAFLATGTIALVRGVVDAASPSLSLTHGYFDSLNSVRLFKAYAWALLLSPLLLDRFNDEPDRSTASLAWGIVGGLAVVASGALWERAAFPGILNFSTDYRTTSFFWEMHVGGAALDGYLALAFPFALWLSIDARRRIGVVIAGTIVLLAVYAALTTFSRGVFLALPFGMVVWATLRARQKPSKDIPGGRRARVTATVYLAASVLIAWAVFRHGGYRGLLSMLMAFAALAYALPTKRSLTLLLSILALGSGLILGAVVSAVGMAVPKGPYVMHALLFAAFAVLALRHRLVAEVGSGFLLVTLSFALVASAVNVSLHWGGTSQSLIVVAAGCLLAGLAVSASRFGPQPLVEGWRPRLWLVGGATLVSATVAVFSGGAYMGERFATSQQDLEGRLTHWSASLSVLKEPLDWAFGKGLGRYPANYFYWVPETELPGSYAWKQEAGNGYLALSGPRYSMSWGDLFRISQRVTPTRGAYTLFLDVRAENDIEIHSEICEKHLLYNENCAATSQPVKASGTEWKRVRFELDGRDLSGGVWYAPRLAFFSLAVASSGRNAAIDNVSLLGPDGHDVVANGDFSHGTERWFFTSDRHHLPWHIKNMFLNVLFEQGVIGLMAFLALLVAFFWRLVWGAMRGHPLAPAVAAAASGFIVVGLFDSLLDVPRVAWLFYLLVTIGLLVARSVAPSASASTAAGS